MALVATPKPTAELVGAFDRHAPYHSHSLGLMQLFLQLVLRAAVGFRGAAAALEIVSPLFPTEESAPSANGGQMWLLRLGLYELSRPKERADDWVLIVDHTIQVGPAKCLVVVGVRLSAWEAKRANPDSSPALEHHDLSVFRVQPVTKSNGPLVCEQLNEVCAEAGIMPVELLSDCGGDVQNGIGRFCVQHPQTMARNDIAHAAANALKRELNHDATWAAFLQEASHAKAKMRQTPLAFLLPPELKAKARWMNLDALVTWSRKAMEFVEAPHPVPGVSLPADELEQEMGWIRKYREPLATWSEMLAATAISLEYIRAHGYHQDAERELQVKLAPFTERGEETPASRVAHDLLKFVGTQSSDIPAGQRLLGSSEVLESLIGKAKHLEGQQSKSGFTKMILGTAASVVKVTEQTLQVALAAVKTEDITRWIRQHLGISVQAQRLHAFASPPGTKPG